MVTGGQVTISQVQAIGNLRVSPLDLPSRRELGGSGELEVLVGVTGDAAVDLHLDSLGGAGIGDVETFVTIDGELAVVDRPGLG